MSRPDLNRSTAKAQQLLHAWPDVKSCLIGLVCAQQARRHHVGLSE